METVYYPDGSMEAVFEETPVFLERVIHERLGPDVAEMFRSYTGELLEEKEAAEAGLGTDLTNFELSLEQNATAFQDIFDLAKEIMGVMQEARITPKGRQTIVHAVRRIGEIVQNNT